MGSLLSAQEQKEFANSLSGKSPVSIRKNPFKPAKISSKSRVPWCPEGFYLSERPIFTLDPEFHAGAYYVQEASSMFLWQVIQQILPAHSITVLDLCAAPGGKSTLIASQLREGDLLVANEVIRNRATILKENVIKWGLTNTIVTNSDPEDLSALPDFFDIIVIDAPCSGEGMWRKDPEAMNEWSESNVELCAARQKRILQDVFDSLKPGGILIYSTCTYNFEENEKNIKWISEQQELNNVPLEVNPEWNIVKTTTNGIDAYRFFPHKLEGEGFFISVMKKPEDDYSPFQKPKKSVFTLLPAKEREQVSAMILHPENFVFTEREELIGIIPKSVFPLVEKISSTLKMVYSFQPIAERKNKDFIPRHELALSVHLNKENFEIIHLELPDALKFLKKEELKTNSESNGWKLIQYNSTPLGWIKQIGNRCNNYYPMEWRIRMEIR